MTSKTLLSSSVNEILGIYSPGAAPTVKETKGISIDITMAHEEGHRELIDTTSLGQYMKALALAVEFGTTEEYSSNARLALVETVEQCWSVQEGYATRRQMAYCVGLNRPDVTRYVWNNLPASYVNAFNLFPIDEEFLKQNLAIVIGDNLDALRTFLHIGLEHAAYVLARAAMSIPIAEVLTNAVSLPSYEASVAIRRHSPDVRLRTLSEKFTRAFTWTCVTSVLQASLEMQKVSTARPLDEQLDALARELSREAGVPYEPSYAVDINEMPHKLGCRREFVQRDGRDLPHEDMESYINNMDVVGKNDLSHLESIPLENAEGFYGDILSKMFGQPKPHVVCELGARTENDGTVAWLHIYATRDEVVNHLNHNGEREKAAVVATQHPDSAQLLLLLPLGIYATVVPSLVERFPHGSWAWVVGDVLLENQSWSLKDLQQSGDVFAIPLSPVANNERRIKNSYALPKTAEVDESIRTRLGHLESVPENIALLVFDDDPALPKAKVVRLASVSYLKSGKLAPVSFEYACVAETLLQGFYSTHILSRRLKGAANE